MKKDNQSNIRRERIIMVTSSALVLGALTLTGVYMRNQTNRSQNDGYTIDFSTLENRAEDKMKEIADNLQTQPEQFAQVPQDDDLDYIPMEAGSDDIKIPGLTEPLESKVVDDSRSDAMSEGTGKDKSKEKPIAEQLPEDDIQKTGENPADSGEAANKGNSSEENPASELPTAQETLADGFILSDDLHFAAETMVKPVSGEPLINYSMNGSVYFQTLDQYKYNPAVIYSAAQGEKVKACTTGRVTQIYSTAELGHVLTMDLGDGYQAVYGQLDNIEVPIGSIVEAGAGLATVAAPTKYYSVEGSNLYFQILKNGESVDPNSFF